MTIRVGITGGIGGGKSYISRMLSSVWGIPVYDCDREAKRLNEENPFIRERLEALVDEGALYDNQGHLIREKLASFLFSSPVHAEQVNAIVHPVVLEDFRLWVEQQKVSVVGMESAILYDCGFDTQVDKVIYVDASDETRLRRAMQRDHSSREQILHRMNIQKAASYRMRADWILWNDGEEEKQLRTHLGSIVEKLNSINNK